MEKENSLHGAHQQQHVTTPGRDILNGWHDSSWQK
jgi:hypothetical protein